jgi:hypothetical protein
MLSRDPNNRLLRADLDYTPVREHPFFSKFEWGLLERRKMEPPQLTKIINSVDNPKERTCA